MYSLLLKPIFDSYGKKFRLLSLTRHFMKFIDFFCFVSLDAVRINPLTKKATDAEVEDVVKDWLRNAKDRSQGRAKRGRLEFDLNDEVENPVEEE